MNIEIKNLLNEQINKELFAFYQYKVIYTYLKNENIALDHLANHFLKESGEENSHAMLLINYLIERGESINYKSIPIPITDFSKENILHDVLHIFEKSLELETNIHEHLLLITEASEKYNDYHLNDFIITNFLSEQNNSEHKLKKNITHIRNLLTDSSPNLALLYFNNTFKEE